MDIHVNDARTWGEEQLAPGRATQVATKSISLGVVLLILVGVTAARGTTISWSQTAAGTYDFSNGANWTGGLAPTLADSPLININTANSIVIDWDASAPNGNFLGSSTQYIVRNAGAGTVTLNIGTGDTARFTYFNGGAYIGTHGMVNLSGDSTAVFGVNSNTSYWPLKVQGTLNQSGGTFVPAGGWTVESGGIYNFSGGASTDQGTVKAGGTVNVTAGTYGGSLKVQGTVNVSGGSISKQFGAGGPGDNNEDNPGDVTISNNGTWIFTMTGSWQGDVGGTWTVKDGGKLQNTQSYVGVRGTLNLEGTASDMAHFPNLFVGDTTGRPGTVNHTGTGTLQIQFTGGDPGLLIGSRRYWNGSSMVTTDAPGTYNIAGGTIQVDNDRSGPSSGLGVSPQGLLSGYGTVEGVADATAYQQFQMSGRTIADGRGVDRTLAFAGTWNALTNPTDNALGGTSGWYATDHGKLTLPSVAVTADAGVNEAMWGESQADADNVPDLVNSARFEFASAGGTVTGSLLALDRNDLVAPLDFFPIANLISLHDFTSTNSSDYSISIRYDPAAAALAGIAETDIELWKYSAGTWEMLGATVNTGNRTIGASGLSGFSYFAIGAPVIPEPASGLLLGLAGLVLLHRRRG